MTHAHNFGRWCKRGFYLSPAMVASGNLGTVTPKRKKKKKLNPFDEARGEVDRLEKEHKAEEQSETGWPNKPTENLSVKSAAYLFGAWMKQAQNPGQTTSGTLSLNAPSQTPAFSTTTSSSGQGLNQPPKAPVSSLPTAPTRSWGGYLADTNNGLMKDVTDTFTHFLPQNTMPWTDAWKSAPQRYKNLPVDRGLSMVGTAAAGTGLAAGATALALPAVAPALASMPVFGTGGAAAGTVAGGVGAGSQTPAGQNLMQRVGDVAQRGSQVIGQAGDFYNTKIDPMLKRLNYKPEDALHDSAAAVTGNFDKVKGPGWGFKTPSLPHGAPSLPKPLETWKTMYGAGSGMLPGANTANTALAHAKM